MADFCKGEKPRDKMGAEWEAVGLRVLSDARASLLADLLQAEDARVLGRSEGENHG